MVSANRVLIIDDDPDIGAYIAQVAKAAGFDPAFVDKPDRVLATYRSYLPGLIVLDLMMPGMDGVQVLHCLAEAKCAADIILISGADSRVLNTAARLGATHGLRIRDNLHKPVDFDDLEAALIRCARAAHPPTEDELRAAICNGEITVHYQPKVSLKVRREWHAEGLEALARWEHPRKGPIAPATFIALAEQTGLIGELSDAVVDQALRFAGVLRKNGHVLEIAINLSPRILADSGLPDHLARRARRHDLANSQVIVEITEGAAMTDDTVAMENLTRFRLKGIKLSMDDFGTGYSSLVQLYRMPFSELKIDRSFVLEVDADEEARTIVRSIVNLGHSLGLNVCAEGVESFKTLEFLRSVGCDQAQGYLISKPVPGDDLMEFLDRNAFEGTAGLASAASRA